MKYTAGPLTLRNLASSDSWATRSHLLDLDGNIVVPAILEPPTPSAPLGGGPFRYFRYASPHFGVDVFRCDLIPGHTAIEMHPGSYVRNTKDCQLLGNRFAEVYEPNGVDHEPGILGSLSTFNAFMQYMQDQHWFDLMIIRST